VHTQPVRRNDLPRRGGQTACTNVRFDQSGPSTYSGFSSALPSLLPECCDELSPVIQRDVNRILAVRGAPKEDGMALR